MHTGIRHHSDLQYSDVAKRWKYSGEVLAAAKAVSDAANGGDVLIGTATLDRLDPDLLTKRCRLLYVGRHVLRGGDSAAAAAATVAAPMLTHPPPPPAPGSIADLFALYSPRLLPRVGLYCPPRTEVSQGLSLMDAPLGHVAYGLLVCHGLSSMVAAGHDSTVVSEARAALTSISQDQLLACHGVPAAPPTTGGGAGGAVVGAFRNPYHAILWALQAQEDLLHFPWTAELLAHEHFEEIVISAAAADALVGGGAPQRESMSPPPPPPPPQQQQPALTYMVSQAPATRIQSSCPALGQTNGDCVPTTSGQGLGALASRTLSNVVVAHGTGMVCSPAIGGGDCTTTEAVSSTTTAAMRTTWASRAQMKSGKWSMASYDGSLASGGGGGGGGGGGTNTWQGGGTSMHIHQSAPGHVMSQQTTSQRTEGATTSVVAPHPPQGTALSNLAFVHSGGTVSSAPYDSGCDALMTDGERDSANAMMLTPLSRQLSVALGMGLVSEAISEEKNVQPALSTPLTVAGGDAARPAPAAVVDDLTPASTTAAAPSAGVGMANVVLYRGPRIKGAITYGQMKAILDPLTGTACGVWETSSWCWCR